jgi:predicted RNase H-like nuclease (RuvC/YqgF family)
MAGFFELLVNVVSLTTTVSRLEKDNEQLRARMESLNARLSKLEGTGEIIVERASRAASEAAIEHYIPIIERVIALENGSLLDQKSERPAARRRLPQG